jgi:Uma2 family endonuclease
MLDLSGIALGIPDVRITAMNQLTAILPTEGQQPFRFSADDYLRMIDATIFGDADVELMDGVLIEMSPSNTQHGRLLVQCVYQLELIFAKSGFAVYSDVITLFDDSNVRAPDIAVVDKDIGERKQLIPADILLAVEIAGSTLNVDIGRKRIDYATAGIRNYWVVDIEGRRTHCYTDPQGADYAAICVVPFGKAVAVPGADGVVVVGSRAALKKKSISREGTKMLL